MNAVKVDRVFKKYGKTLSLRDVSLSLETGKIYGLVGPNGSGKSTTLKMIAGLVYPNSGKVVVNGTEATRQISEQVAYLTEFDMFYHSFTVKKMIAFYNSQFADFDLSKANQLVKDMRLESDKKVKQLSKGNRGRLKLVLTLARKAPVLLLDEPFSGLDPMVRDAIVKSLISYIDFEKQTVLIATHEIDEIEPLLDEAIIISHGQFIAQENVEHLREEKGMSILQWFKSVIEQKEGGYHE
jgi:ABC-2 type transport system ATP-binding protein